MSEPEKYLIDPDICSLPENKDVVWCTKDELQGIFSELGKGACETVENLIIKIGESMK